MRITKRTTLLALALVLAGGGTGCGSGDDEPAAAKEPAKGAAEPAATERYTTEQVAQTFEVMTGMRLRTDATAGAPYTIMTPERSVTGSGALNANRYGTFSVYVINDPKAAALIYAEQDGKPVKPSGDGMYWRDLGGTWTAYKVKGNVAVQWVPKGGERKLDERFERVSGVLAQVGNPIEQVKQAVPAGERPCAEPGISATTGPAGSCREGEQQLTFVDRDAGLKLASASVRFLRAETGAGLKSPYGTFTRAKGRFVILRVRVSNTGDEPVSSLSQARLTLGGKVYAQDSGSTYLVSPPRAFPIQPEDASTVGVVFDLPPATARRALREGTLAFPAGEDDFDLEHAAEVGHIRLGKVRAAGSAA